MSAHLQHNRRSAYTYPLAQSPSDPLTHSPSYALTHLPTCAHPAQMTFTSSTTSVQHKGSEMQHESPSVHSTQLHGACAASRGWQTSPRNGHSRCGQGPRVPRRPTPAAQRSPSITAPAPLPPSPHAHPTNYSAAQALLEEAKAAAGIDPDAHFDLLVMSANVDGRGKGVAAALRGLLVFAAIASARAAVCTEETKPDMWAGGPGTTPTAPASTPHDPASPPHPRRHPPRRLLLRPSSAHSFKGLALALNLAGAKALRELARHRSGLCTYPSLLLCAYPRRTRTKALRRRR